MSPTATPPAEQSDPGNQEATDSKPLTSFSEVAEYLRTNGKLPPNFITKSEASALGWDAKKLNLDKVAPGKSIGGDRFGNREGLLPSAKGRIWYEADIHYKSGGRGADRIVFSNDGLIYMTTDHYKSFTDITAKGP
ncbi:MULTISPECIES: ribonuclease domain-containing protein [unclassified Paenibacillus]|uniref:ribonuclease domain-containing protein n=1 Tax=unclassified Paenibacillus TaxID=185978 RepID=UPI003D7CBEE2